LVAGAAAAFISVDGHFEVLFYPFGDAFEHALGGSFALDVDGDVVGVAHEAQAAVRQFFVQWVEVDIGQQRR